MTREELIAAIKEVAAILTEEIDRPGGNEDRYRALKRAEKLALTTLGKVEWAPGQTVTVKVDGGYVNEQ